MKKPVVCETAPEAIGPYSQAIELDLREAKTQLYVSGQIPINRADGTMPEGIVAQTEQVMKNIKAILETAGLSMSDVVKTTVLLQNMADFGKMNETYASFFTEPYPARAAFEVAKLPKDALVEIEAIAVK